MALGSANKRLGYDTTRHYFLARRCAYGIYAAKYERVAATEEGNIDIRYWRPERRQRQQCDSSIESRGMG